MLQLNGFTRDSLKEIEEKVTNTHTEGKKKYFTGKYICMHAQARERERERLTDSQSTDKKRDVSMKHVIVV